MTRRAGGQGLHSLYCIRYPVFSGIVMHSGNQPANEIRLNNSLFSCLQGRAWKHGNKAHHGWDQAEVISKPRKQAWNGPRSPAYDPGEHRRPARVSTAGKTPWNIVRIGKLYIKTAQDRISSAVFRKARFFLVVYTGNEDFLSSCADMTLIF